ncbi:hypothetical protein OOT46_27250 [Aquabacterium sp. A7-Y]|uniref:hypothetical protein n=1 Tax=Aquabacterium sp. A7-Y TaxID=1349605 RepID=UPI00223D529C|nr:hypothetical protein [Aquabacterium sp. A7-Y]MCW7541507.1 hypothetical protein [Aquabacterium sp. A7-Y]
MQRLRRLLPSYSVRSASRGWVPVVLALMQHRAAHVFLERGCRRFEPQATVMACDSPGDLLLKSSVWDPDLLVVDPLACEGDLASLVRQLRQARPASCIVALVAGADIAGLPGCEVPGLDAALAPAELDDWLAEGLARMRCRSQLAALTLGPFYDTTRPATLMPA